MTCRYRRPRFEYARTARRRRRAAFSRLPNFVDCLIPRDVLPFGTARPSDLRLEQAPLIQDVLFQRSALGTERTAVDRMVWIALDVHDLRCHVLRSIADGVDDHAAAHRAVGAGGTGLACPSDLQRSQLRLGGTQVEPKDGGRSPASGCQLQELSSGGVHRCRRTITGQRSLPAHGLPAHAAVTSVQSY